MLVSSQTDFSLYVGSTTSYHPKLSWWTAEQRKVRRRNMWREARLWYLSIWLSGIFWGKGELVECTAYIAWSSWCGGQAWWLQIQVPNYSRSDTIFSLSKEMAILSYPKNAIASRWLLLERHFWGSFEVIWIFRHGRTVLSFRTHRTLQSKPTTFQIKSTGRLQQALIRHSLVKRHGSSSVVI